MCGIVGAIAQRNVSGILVEGLKRLEYRGYDSAGVAVLEASGSIACRKTAGKVAALEAKLDQHPARGLLGIAHTRWATHGVPNEVNAHPHTSGSIAVVHNGIIENHDALRRELTDLGYRFVSQTDTEVVAHLVNHYTRENATLFEAVQAAIARVEGAYALGIISAEHPDVLIAARSGSPLVVGVGIEENFIASDQMALRQVTDRFVYLEEGDIAEIRAGSYRILAVDGTWQQRQVTRLTGNTGRADKGEFRHFMLKEIFEQPEVLQATLAGRLSNKHVLAEAFGRDAVTLLQQVKNIHIIACGTSYHAGLVARYWFEDWAGIPCQVEVASEYRYRKVVVTPGTLFVSVSQSGETADTLAALRSGVDQGYLASLTVCNVPSSSLVRESNLAIMTEAGPEIGVASTKAFTTQLAALQMLAIVMARYNGMVEEREAELVKALHQLPALTREVLALDKEIEATFQGFAEKHHALFLGRGVEYPIALEGALKLKEISYIHAEAYPAGELKHGPLALVDDDMPVIAVAPNNELLEKLKSNLHEVQARGGKLFVFADRDSGFVNQEGVTVINLPHVPKSLEPIIYTLPLQLLSYYVAILKGTDVDQPRNLAKSVTVE